MNSLIRCLVMKRLLLIPLMLWCTLPAFGQQKAPFVLVSQSQRAVIVLTGDETEPVRLAIQDLIRDVEKITGKTLGTANKKMPGQAAVFIQTKAGSAPEQFELNVRNGDLYITGTSPLGTVFGIYYFIEHYLGVDPMYFWNDRAPQKRAVLRWETIQYQSQKPTFRYRGWFINDEDLLTEWYESSGRRNIDYPFYQQVASPNLIAKVCETALRLQFNLIIPASFIDIRNPAEAVLIQEASKRGLFVSMHHVEPMGVSAFSYFNYWKAKDGSSPLFSYFSNREKVEEVWRVYAREWAKYPNVIWQIGLRGIADRPMWLADPNTPQTDADRGKLISDAMAFQMRLIQEVDPRPNPPVTTTLWAEGSVLNQAGHLRIPEKVTVVFADNSPGWRWQADFMQTPRSQKNTYGVYYHHQLWGSGPHLVQIVPPAQTYKVLSQAVQKGDTTYCILNVSNVREFQLGIAASAEMLRDFAGFDTRQFNDQWFAERFGSSAKAVAQAYQTYFDSFVLNDNTGTPILMDGQTASLGAGMLTELKAQLTDSVQYQAILKNKQTETEESKWIKSAIGDMRSGDLSLSEQLVRVVRQREGLMRADALAIKIAPQLTPEQRLFFEVNFVAQIKIMLGLEDWLMHLIQAKLAADAADKSSVIQHLQEATRAISLAQQGKALSAKPEKWKDWYRGDKKLNLARKEALTNEVITLLN
ncbi:hypothetical protein EQG79_02230 [Spirosoma sordidisoli]|uniref:Beta-hexosaminidase bacterial type N-terminal domain-containing protein n=2 Tax=Spirosoma sordidisoli TaxID=2502893 RepID=A0A4Q2UMV8_9BACT|nr:hypothetical protein EQG79_02230 [Spirosoma sordidisoli]